ncbi:bacterial sugar transferase [Corynebacterium glucuronolyticum ATCC 51867]|nr:bacterial sugar transferase [Corynebacterium glucuronolyticum ATCC 51867]
MMIKLDDGGPIFHLAARRGKDGVPFTMYKYRSMYVGSPDLRNPDRSTVTKQQDARITKVGRVLRKTSLDELPQFINVLKGDMSIVGPRPNLVGRPLEEFSELEKKRLAVKPGITGMAQATSRNQAQTTEKYELDCAYVDDVSLRNDLKIMLMTVVSVLKQRGIYSKTR